jgi:hypothetical protein
MSVERLRQLATEGAYLAQRLAVNLLAATQAAAPEPDRIARMTDAYAIWPLLCRHMAELEDMAPRTSNAGRDRDDAMLERLAAFRARQLTVQTTIEEQP